MKMLVTALMLGSAAVSPPVLAAPQAAQAQASAEQLVSALLPEPAMVAVGSRAFDAGMEEQLAADAAAKKRFDANPGLKAHVAGVVRTDFVETLKRDLPALRTSIAAILKQDLTPGEINDTLTFFNSNVGRRLMTQIYQSIGDKPDQSQEELQQAASASVMANLQPEDMPALMAFGTSTAAAKMQAVNPKISAASQAWAAKLIASHGPRLKALAEKATADYLAKAQ